MTDVHVHQEVRAASWGAIAGGAVTVLAISFLLTLLGAALGFGMVDAQSDDPLAGVGAAFGLSSAVAILLSLAAGGFVAGRLAGRTGLTHGFLTWAVTLIIAVGLSLMAVTGAARMTASALGAAVSVAGSAAGTVAGAAGNAAGLVIDGLDENLIGEIDLREAGRTVRTALRNSEIEALQPQKLEAAFDAAREDVTAALRELRLDPGALGRIAGDLAASLKERAGTIAGEIDRDEVVTALTNAGMTRAEAEQAADRAIRAYEDARQTVETRIAAAERTIDQARQRLADIEEEARRQADAAATAASSASLWAFFAALIGAAVSSFAGLAGARSRDRFAFD